KHVRVIFWLERSQIMYPRLVPLLLLGVVNQQVIEGRLQIGQVLFDDIAGPCQWELCLELFRRSSHGEHRKRFSGVEEVRYDRRDVCDHGVSSIEAVKDAHGIFCSLSPDMGPLVCFLVRCQQLMYFLDPTTRFLIAVTIRMWSEYYTYLSTEEALDHLGGDSNRAVVGI